MARKQDKRTGKKRGRPTKLNHKVSLKICDAIVAGATYEAAAQYAGISYETFNEWMKAGRAAATPDPFSEFSEAVEVANASAQVQFVLNIKRAANAGDWRAAAWMLERRFPKAYGQRVGAIDEKSLDDAIEAELARLAAARQGAVTGETTEFAQNRI